jgi:hypothetical protein
MRWQHSKRPFATAVSSVSSGLATSTDTGYSVRSISFVTSISATTSGLRNPSVPRLLLAVLCHQTAATDGDGRSLVASALSFPTDLLALVCDHLGKTRGCPGQSAWQKGDFVMRSTRSGVTFIPDLPARVDNELFAWHVPLKTGAPSAKRARTTSRR